MNRLWLVLALAGLLTTAATAPAGPHPIHDDGGAVNWRPDLPSALRLAQSTGKPVLIEACREACGICKSMAATTLRDVQVSQTIRRHFVAVVVDVDRAPPELRPLFQKTGGNVLPFLIYVNNRGQYLHGTSAGRNPQQMLADMEKVLGDRGLAMPKTREAEVSRQVQTLKTALANKKFKEATAAYKTMQRVRGYSSQKDRAHDLMDTAQKEATRKLQQALTQARANQFDRADSLLSEVVKDFAGLPAADEAKEQQAALPYLRKAHQLTESKKGAWKRSALQQLNLLLTKYVDTPFANLALRRRTELLKP